MRLPIGRLPIRQPGLLVKFLEHLRGRDQLLIRASDALPLVVASYPRGRAWFASSLQSALVFTYRSAPPKRIAEYREALEKVPSLLVVELRARNAGETLGHNHPPGTESRLARRLMADTGQRVGEIDLAMEAIREWEPWPLSALAAFASQDSGDAVARAGFEYQRFRIALLAVFLHELEHLAFPSRPEKEIRQRSDRLYVSMLRDLAAEEFGVAYGFEPVARV